MVKNKVLITGGAGYLGSVLTEHLLGRGYYVTCLDNLMYRQNSLIQCASNSKFDFIFGDVRDEKLLKKILGDYSTIIPLAAIVGMPACDEKMHDAQTINHDAVLMINEIRSPEQKLIFPNTNSGYGTKTGEVYCTEETLLEPISFYGITKTNVEKKLLESEKPAITLRLATVFGVSPRMRTDLLVNDFVLRAIRDGYLTLYEKNFKRNYIHIKDVARAFEHCIANFEKMKGCAYNVGLENANFSKEELALKIKNYVPKLEIFNAPIGEDPDKRNYLVSNKRIMSTGFVPEYSLDDGIEELIKCYKIILKNDPLKNI